MQYTLKQHFDPIELRDECEPAQWTVCPPVCVCVCLAVSGRVYEGQWSVCLWGRLVGGVKKVPVCDWA